MSFIPALTALTKSDIVSSDFWASQFASFTPASVLLVLICALITGVVISAVYKITYRGVLYSPQFSMVLIMLVLITAPVVMAIGSNVALSMGMVGALSIVRFRTAIKEPLDTCYMFWAITMGILIGADRFVIVVVALLGIAAIMLGISYFRLRSPNGYLLVLHYDEEATPDIEATLRRNVRFYRVRSKTVTRSGAEMTVEIRLDHRVNIVTDMLDIAGVYDATLVACQTEAGA